MRCCPSMPSQDWGSADAKFDPLPALVSWAARPTLTRWQQFALVGEYERYDPVADLLQGLKQASSQRAAPSKYCPLSALSQRLRAERQGSGAAAPAAPAPAAEPIAASSEGEAEDRYSRLLAALSRAAAEPGIAVRGRGGGWMGCRWCVDKANRWAADAAMPHLPDRNRRSIVLYCLPCS